MPANRQRGLCWTCAETPGIRASYPPASKFGGRHFDTYTRRPVPDAPTAALPGTWEKIEALMKRAEKHQALFHPDDATLEGVSVPAFFRPHGCNGGGNY